MMENTSLVQLLTLTGFNYTWQQRCVLFSFTLLWYLLILLFNLGLIAVIIMDKKLHQPMYIFLCSLCMNALYGTVGFYPKFLLDMFTSHIISYAGCMLQGYVIHSSVCCDFSILALMAYDRYVAICQPLLYHSIMTKLRISVFVFFSWLIPLLCMFMNTATILASHLCGSTIRRIYCVNFMVASLACSPPRGITAVTYFNVCFFSGHAVFIVWTYVFIIKTCRSSKQNQGKFMATCLPHLICLISFSTAVLLDVMHIRFGSADASQELINFMAIEFLLVPPVLNPLVYGFQLSNIRNRIYSRLFVNLK